MATPSDVVSELVKLTESGELEWKPNLFDDAGLPTHWSNARRDDCLFEVYKSGPQVRIYSATAGIGWHRLDRHRTGRRRQAIVGRPLPETRAKRQDSGRSTGFCLCVPHRTRIEPPRTTHIITCEEVRAHGIAPIHRGHPAYQYMNDADGDGVVKCSIRTVVQSL